MLEKVEKKAKPVRRFASTSRLPFTKWNFRLFALAMIVLGVGYWALAQPPVNGFLTLTLAPILLVIGYCVLIPLAILYREKSNSSQ